jgi:hypothetical protein
MFAERIRTDVSLQTDGQSLVETHFSFRNVQYKFENMSKVTFVQTSLVFSVKQFYFHPPKQPVLYFICNYFVSSYFNA